MTEDTEVVIKKGVSIVVTTVVVAVVWGKLLIEDVSLPCYMGVLFTTIGIGILWNVLLWRWLDGDW